jgi:hypothetical protein
VVDRSAQAVRCATQLEQKRTDAIPRVEFRGDHSEQRHARGREAEVPPTSSTERSRAGRGQALAEGEVIFSFVPVWEVGDASTCCSPPSTSMRNESSSGSKFWARGNALPNKHLDEAERL